MYVCMMCIAWNSVLNSVNTCTISYSSMRMYILTNITYSGDDSASASAESVEVCRGGRDRRELDDSRRPLSPPLRIRGEALKESPYLYPSILHMYVCMYICMNEYKITIDVLSLLPHWNTDWMKCAWYKQIMPMSLTFLDIAIKCLYICIYVCKWAASMQMY